MLVAGLALTPIAERPLHLEISQAGDQLVINIVAESQTPLSAKYELDVSGGQSGTSNHSVQRGTANIQPGKPVTISTVRLGNNSVANCTVSLRVTPSTGVPYEFHWRSGS